MSTATPRDPRLYTKVKQYVYTKYPKHSAYRSGLLVQTYKLMFRKKHGPNQKPYIGSKTHSTGLSRWFREKWRNSRGRVGYQYQSDIYRPTKRITPATPVTHQELTKSEVRRARHDKLKYGRVNRFSFQKKKKSLIDIFHFESRRLVTDCFNSTNSAMYVVKRNGSRRPVQFDKITNRIAKLCFDLSPFVNPTHVAQKVVLGLYDGVSTVELDHLASETAAQMSTTHPDYSILAGRLEVSNLHKCTDDEFSAVFHRLADHKIVQANINEFVQQNAAELNANIDHQQDFTYDYFGFKTLERAYLLKIDRVIVERPQYMLMRVACQLHFPDVQKVLNTYKALSQKLYTHATPTLFNSCLVRPQLASCFLMTVQSDSIHGIMETLKKCALISKYAGGIGVSIANVRGTHAKIRGTNGTSNGLVPMLRVFNSLARYVDQGGGKRPGSIAAYMEMHHPDIMEFLELRKNNGAEEKRCRDLFTGLWISDLFMKRVQADGKWTLFCPDTFPGLQDKYGMDYETLYLQYEQQPTAPVHTRKTLSARNVWMAILNAQQETGTPYIMFKNACNAKSNQKNLGTIRSSNLCTEIVQYSNSKEIAVCNLASIAVPKFVRRTDDPETNSSSYEFDFKQLYSVVKMVVVNLNQVINRSFYPLPETQQSNLAHRPMGIGIQGLATLFMKLKLPYESKTAQKLQEDIYETMYFAALETSMNLVRKHGRYRSFDGSPASKGLLQFDLWDQTVDNTRHDWVGLKENIRVHGLANSLLIAQMPTASTSQILGNTESCEPLSSNAYVRRTGSGEFQVVNPFLIKDLIDLQLWDADMKYELIRHGGSVQNIERIPQSIKDIYKTVYEMKQRILIQMSAARGKFICQSESFNCFVARPSARILNAMHFYSWKKGLKTGCYYLRTKPASQPQQITLPVVQQQRNCESCSA